MHAREWKGATDVMYVVSRVVSKVPLRFFRRVSTAILGLVALTCAFGASNVVEYTYDAAGNIVQIARQAPPGLAITSFDPVSGPPGTAVTIYGTGFDPSPANDTVKFNGTIANVTASASGSISATVPSGATTGLISVTVGASTAASTQPFTITSPGAPTITGFTPTSGAEGISVTVAGTSFDTAAGATSVKLNGVAAAPSVGSDTSLSFPVPASVSSGRITVTTGAGSVSSAADFIVPPTGVNAADVAATTRVSPGGANANIAVPTVNKHGLVLFDAQPGVYYSVQFGSLATSPTTATVGYHVINPDNTVLQTGAITGTSNRPTIHLPLLASSGTYSVLLSPGSATLNTSVRVEVDPSTTVDGPPIASSLDFNYQSARFLFSAAADQHVGVGAVGIAFTPASAGTPSVGMRVLQANGAQVTSFSCYGNQSGNPENNCDAEFVAPVTGTYSLVMDTPATLYANASVQFSSEVAGSLIPDASQAVALPRVGQDARFTFTASAGDSLAIDLSDSSLSPRPQSLNVSVWKPDGGRAKSCSATPPAPLYCDLYTLSAAGAYTVTVDPAFGAFGSFNLDLKQGPMLQSTDPPTAFAPPGVSETARFRFSATAGQNLTLGLANLAYDIGSSSSGFSVFAPNGTAVGAAGTCNTITGGGYCRWSGKNLPQTGTYSVLVQPPAGARISGDVTLSEEITGALAPFTAEAVNATRQGQIARYTFAGTSGDSTSVKLVGASTAPAGRTLGLYVYQPSGAVLASTTVAANASASFLNFASLPASGTYSVVVDPQTGGAWQGSLLLDPGAPIDVDGALVSASSSNPGETLRYVVSLTGGQRIEFGMTGFAYSPTGTANSSVALYGPTGTSAMNVSCSPVSGACEGAVASVPATGTYSLVLAPPPGNAITSGSFALSTPVAGTFVPDDPPQTVAIARAGQTARYTFTGTVAQALRLNWSSVATSGTGSVGVFVYKPDGGLLTNSSFANGANGGLDLPALPVSGSYTVAFDPAAAQTMSASVSLVSP